MTSATEIFPGTDYQQAMGFLLVPDRSAARDLRLFGDNGKIEDSELLFMGQNSRHMDIDLCEIKRNSEPTSLSACAPDLGHDHKTPLREKQQLLQDKQDGGVRNNNLQKRQQERKVQIFEVVPEERSGACNFEGEFDKDRGDNSDTGFVEVPLSKQAGDVLMETLPARRDASDQSEDRNVYSLDSEGRYVFPSPPDSLPYRQEPLCEESLGAYGSNSEHSPHLKHSDSTQSHHRYVNDNAKSHEKVNGAWFFRRITDDAKISLTSRKSDPWPMSPLWTLMVIGALAFLSCASLWEVSRLRGQLSLIEQRISLLEDNYVRKGFDFDPDLPHFQEVDEDEEVGTDKIADTVQHLFPEPTSVSDTKLDPEIRDVQEYDAVMTEGANSTSLRRVKRMAWNKNVVRKWKKYIRRTILQDRSSNVLPTLTYTGYFWDHFKYERDFKNDECSPKPDWPNTPSGCRGGLIKFPLGDSPFAFFMPTNHSKSAKVQFLKQTKDHAFTAQVNGVYLLQSFVSFMDKTHRHSVGIFVNDVIQTACRPGGFRCNHLNVAGTTVFRVCSIQAVVDLQVNDVIQVKTLEPGMQVKVDGKRKAHFRAILLHRAPHPLRHKGKGKKKNKKKTKKPKS